MDKDNDKKNNFIRIDRKGKLKVYYIINQDKASNYKLYNTNKELNKILIENTSGVKIKQNKNTKLP